MESLIELFLHVDDFCQTFLTWLEPEVPASGVSQHRRAKSLSLGEVFSAYPDQKHLEDRAFS